MYERTYTCVQVYRYDEILRAAPTGRTAHFISLINFIQVLFEIRSSSGRIRRFRSR